MSRKQVIEVQHKCVKLTYQQKKATAWFKPDDSSQQKLNAIHTKVAKKWSSLKQYTLSIKTHNKEMIVINDADTLSKILKQTKSKIVIHITDPFVPKKSVKSTQLAQEPNNTNNTFNIIVHYNKKRIISPFPLDITLWNDDNLYALKSKTKQKFQIKSECALYTDMEGNDEIDDISDMKAAFDYIKKDKKITSNFKFNLFVKIEDDDEKQYENIETKDENYNMAAHVTGINVFYANLDIDSKKVLWKYRHKNKNLSEFNDMALNMMKFTGDPNLLWKYIGAVDNPDTNKRKMSTSSIPWLPSFPEFDEFDEENTKQQKIRNYSRARGITFYLQSLYHPFIHFMYCFIAVPWLISLVFFIATVLLCILFAADSNQVLLTATFGTLLWSITLCLAVCDHKKRFCCFSVAAKLFLLYLLPYAAQDRKKNLLLKTIFNTLMMSYGEILSALYNITMTVIQYVVDLSCTCLLYMCRFVFFAGNFIV